MLGISVLVGDNPARSTTMASKIVAVVIGPFARNWMESMTIGLPKVHAKFDDGTEKELFSFYPDELSFSEREFIGLTEDQARDLRTRKDIAFLRS